MNILLTKILDQILDTKSENAQTSNEMNVYLRLIMMRNNDNYVQGVYWKELVDFLKISKSGYYHCIIELERKGYIKRVKLNRMDTDIIIEDNDLKNFLINLENRENHDQYINLNMSIFNEIEFYQLKANEKRLIFHFLRRCTNQNQGKISYNPGEEFEIYAKRLGVDKLPEGKKKEDNEYRCIKKYFKHIKKWIQVSDDIYVNGKPKHIVSILKKTTAIPKKLFTQNGELREANIYAEYDCQEHILKTFLRRNKIQYDAQNLADTTWLIKQYKKRFKSASEDIYTYIKGAILTSLEETLELTSKVVNKILSNISNKINETPVKEAATAPEPNTYNKYKKPAGKNKFNNFNQREYDYNKLEKELLGIKDDPDPDIENLIPEF